ncbi:unnamed protein product [marine sediment metagenome]|uniref:Uncharacterized protein n=1 Tax=marine sediment metagenome TaxID=412755 RepID=X1TB04_9ZZZZ
MTLMNEKVLRKPHNVKINPDVLREAHIEALRSKKKLEKWLEEAIEEEIEREQKNLKQKRPAATGPSEVIR